MKNRFNILIMALMLAIGASAQVTQYTPGITTDGLVYRLPKTAIRLQLLVERTTYTPGNFCGYSELYLDTPNPSSEPSTSYRIIGISSEAYGIADTTKCYAVKLNNKLMTNTVELTDDGFLLAINTNATKHKSKLEEKPVFTNPGKPLNPRDFMSADILKAGSVSKMAQLTAEEIYDIRDSRNQLNRGEADFMPKDGVQLKVMLNNLATQEKALTQAFLGATVRDTVAYNIEYCPKGEVKKGVLARFSKHLGLLDSDDVSGAPLYITVTDLHTLPAEQIDPKAKKKPEDGIVVNIPSRARITIEDGEKRIQPYTFETSMAQIGRTDVLSNELFGKKIVTMLQLSPVTGAVIKIESKNL